MRPTEGAMLKTATVLLALSLPALADYVVLVGVD